MKKASIKFRKGIISDYNRFDNTYTLTVLFDVNGKSNRYEKGYSIKNKPENIFTELVNEVKERTRSKLSMEDDDNNILSGHVSIDMDNLENFENKFNIFLKRFYDRTTGFRRDNNAEGYINRLHSMKDNFEENF